MNDDFLTRRARLESSPAPPEAMTEPVPALVTRMPPIVTVLAPEAFSVRVLLAVLKRSVLIVKAAGVSFAVISVSPAAAKVSVW